MSLAGKLAVVTGAGSGIGGDGAAAGSSARAGHTACQRPVNRYTENGKPMY